MIDYYDGCIVRGSSNDSAFIAPVECNVVTSSSIEPVLVGV